MGVSAHHQEASGDRGPNRSVRRIVGIVVAATLVLVGLALWVLVTPYRTEAAGLSLDCDVDISWTEDAAGREAEETFDRTCADDRRDRRRTALLIGAAVGTVAAAASTIPSRRLTGEHLGPES